MLKIIVFVSWSSLVLGIWIALELEPAWKAREKSTGREKKKSEEREGGRHAMQAKEL